jgi:hypothetical protein
MASEQKYFIYKIVLGVRTIQHYTKEVFIEATSMEEAENLALEQLDVSEGDPATSLCAPEWICHDDEMVDDISHDTDYNKELCEVPPGTLEEIEESIASGPNTEISIAAALDSLQPNPERHTSEEKGPPVVT